MEAIAKGRATCIPRAGTCCTRFATSSMTTRSGSRSCAGSMPSFGIRLLPPNRFNLFGGNSLMPKLGIEPAQDREPLRVVIDDVANRVQHVPALGIHVARPFAIASIRADDRTVVPYPVTR